TFDGDGWDFFNPSFATPVDVLDMAVRPDGKFAITGNVYSIGGDEALSCWRNANGGTSNCINLYYDLGGQNHTYGAGIAVQSNNKSVLVGYANGPVNDPDYVAMALRLTSSNTIDSSWNGGTGAVQYNPTFSAEADTVTVVNDKIYLAGTVGLNVSGGNEGSDIFVMVRNADGTPDSNFGASGWTHAEYPFIGIEEAYARQIAVDPLGRVVVGGGSWDTFHSLHVVRFTAAGDLDDSFSGNGRQEIVVNLMGSTTYLASMTVDRFSRVVLVAKAFTATGARLVVVRLTAAGELDNSFGGGDGIADFAYGSTDDIINVQDVVALSPPSDRLAIVGDYDPPGADLADGFLLVLTPAGTLDTTFNGTGKRAFAPPTGAAQNNARALVAQSGRLVVLGGYDYSSTSNNLAWMARVQVSLIFGDDFDAGHLELWSSVVH
ncbi:MAG: hypothetical protein ABI639_08470, partial [Thermoanaerobaculia bacterium]